MSFDYHNHYKDVEDNTFGHRQFEQDQPIKSARYFWLRIT